ncbi:MAG: hypothetical protein HY320_02980, partial [Armatimonadetes bacterium]|nr:hypothetical protein [Armatimonadota bacterium]
METATRAVTEFQAEERANREELADEALAAAERLEGQGWQIIKPHHGWVHIDWSEIWRYRELL